MTNGSFIDYAEVYDTLYYDKNYERECSYIENLLSTYKRSSISSILDIACGTGGHSIVLAERRFSVTAQDISPTMVDIGKHKASKLGVQISWNPGLPMQDFSLNKKFDAIICMFSSIDYVLDNDELNRTFCNVRKHLFKDGLFIFDFWNRPAVERMYSAMMEKVGCDSNRTVRRTSCTDLDRARHLANITMKWRVNEDEKVVFYGEEKHTCRYFDVEEMYNFVETSGLHILNMHPFLKPNSDIDHDTWNVTAVCNVI